MVHSSVGKTFVVLASSVLKVLKKAIAQKIYWENLGFLKICENRETFLPLNFRHLQYIFTQHCICNTKVKSRSYCTAERISQHDQDCSNNISVILWKLHKNLKHFQIFSSNIFSQESDPLHYGMCLRMYIRTY